MIRPLDYFRGQFVVRFQFLHHGLLTDWDRRVRRGESAPLQSLPIFCSKAPRHLISLSVVRRDLFPSSTDFYNGPPGMTRIGRGELKDTPVYLFWIFRRVVPVKLFNHLINAFLFFIGAREFAQYLGRSLRCIFRLFVYYSHINSSRPTRQRRSNIILFPHISPFHSSLYYLVVE